MIDRTYDCVIATRRLQRRFKIMKVVKDFESSVHKAVTFLVERASDAQEVREFEDAKSFCQVTVVVKGHGNVRRKEGKQTRRRKIKGGTWRRM